jgi:hypothetical protein
LRPEQKNMKCQIWSWTICALQVLQLAFAFQRPEQDFDEQQFNDWALRVNQNVPPSMGAMAALRRLHYEAEIVLTATLKASVEQPQDISAPRAMPHAERTARLDQIRRQFPGLSMEGIHEPSQALLDECAHQYDTKVIRYIEPAKCNSRELEISVGKSDRKLRIETNSLTIRETKNTPEEDVSSAYKLQLCLKRRAIAYEFANLISYSVHERYVDKLLRRLNTDPPPNYQQTSLSQILKADREVWIFLAQQVSDIRPKADGSKPLDDALHEALRDYNVVFHMLPLPVPQSSSYAPMRSKDEPHHQAGYKGQSAGKKGKGKNKGQNQGSSVAPRVIKGAVGRDAKGRAICFNYNLSDCADAPAGGSCRRGRHVCFKANCFKPHAFHASHPDEMPKQTSS